MVYDDEDRVQRFNRDISRKHSLSSVRSITGQEQYNVYSGPTSESIPSSYTSFHHSRRRYKPRSSSTRRSSSIDVEEFVDNDDDNQVIPISQRARTSSAISTDSIRNIAESIISSSFQKKPSTRARSSSRSSFKFFTQNEVEQAKGASTVTDEIDPVQYESYSRRYSKDGEELSDEDDQSMLDDDPILRNPHQYPARYTYEVAEDEGIYHSTEEPVIRRRRSSDYYQAVSSDDPLLELASQIDHYQQPRNYLYESSTLCQQRFYISEEDMVIFIAGYKISKFRKFFYRLLCILTFGLAYLLLRWFPRLRNSFIAYPESFGSCDFVIIENQWGELSEIQILNRKYNRPLSSIFRISDEKKGILINEEEVEDTSSTIQDDFEVPYMRWFEYRYIKFIYNPTEDIFLTNQDWVDNKWVNEDYRFELFRQGLESDIVLDRGLVFGANLIDIKQKTTVQLLVEEALHPFYIFQVFSIILWAFDTYYYYAGCIFFISVVSVANTLIETKKTLARIRDISRSVCEVRVIRNGYWTTISSAELVPGDIYEISDPSLSLIPCDSVLLSGDCIINESMLTGESVPVTKVPAEEETWQYLTTTSKDQGSNVSPQVVRHYLYCGTKIIRVQKPDSEPSSENVALAMVVRTGFSTTKGALVRSMLFPKPSGFKFYQDSFKYIGVMAIIAVVGFTICTANFIRMHLEMNLIILRALDIITIVVPPALPATLTIGTNISLSRLQNKNIFCISPSRVNVGGKLDVICFDKTGTLTEDGLDVLGVRVVEQEIEVRGSGSDKQFSGLYNVINRSQSKDMVGILATCHSLRSIDGELVGDPLDVKMFAFTNWEFDEFNNSRISRNPQNTRDQLACVRQFEFVSHLRRMSVIVRDKSKYKVFVKGAPEVMSEVCDPASFPKDYFDQLHYYTHRGYRVIACAVKSYTIATSIDKLSRDQVESDLKLVGFIIFENKLKPDTSRVIKQLNMAKIRSIMCTGDNVFTAISVGKDCHIIRTETEVFIPHYEDENNQSVLKWKNLDDESEVYLDSNTMLPSHKNCDYTLAVTGDAFRYILQYGSEQQIEQMLMWGSIFARMSPDEKHELVEKLQMINYTTGFCGDGANDCGALKTADVGISLSEAEASVAAPFTSRIFEISCVLDVIKEGRCALTTSFSCFKYMSLYSAIQFVSVSILYSLGSNLGDMQFLWIDLFLILPIAIFMAWSEPYEPPKGNSGELAVKRPTANLVSRKILIPLIGQIVVMAIGQFLIWEVVILHSKESWYVPPIKGGDDAQVASSDNTALFIASCFQYIFIAMILSVGAPYRQPMYKNGPFLLTTTVAILLTVSMLTLAKNGSFVANVMLLCELSNELKSILIFIVLLDFVGSWVAEQSLFPELANAWKRIKRALGYGKKHSNKRYKVLQQITNELV